MVLQLTRRVGECRCGVEKGGGDEGLSFGRREWVDSRIVGAIVISLILGQTDLIDPMFIGSVVHRLA